MANPKDDRKLRLMKIVPARELQKWSAQTPTGLARWGERVPVISRLDDLLAAAFNMPMAGHHGFAFLEGSTGRTVGVSNDPETIPVGFDTEGALLTAGRLGICRWPRTEDAGSGTLLDRKSVV